MVAQSENEEAGDAILSIKEIGGEFLDYIEYEALPRIPCARRVGVGEGK